MNLTEYDQRLKKKLYMEHDDDNMSNKKKKNKTTTQEEALIGRTNKLIMAHVNDDW